MFGKKIRLERLTKLKVDRNFNWSQFVSKYIQLLVPLYYIKQIPVNVTENTEKYCLLD